MRRWKLPTLPTGGLCVIASASACVDFFFDFVTLRGCIGADGAFTVAAIASCPSPRRPRGVNASTFAPRDDNPGTYAIRHWRGTAGDRPRSRAGARRSGHTASDHPGYRAEA